MVAVGRHRPMCSKQCTVKLSKNSINYVRESLKFARQQVVGDAGPNRKIMKVPLGCFAPIQLSEAEIAAIVHSTRSSALCGTAHFDDNLGMPFAPQKSATSYRSTLIKP